MGRTRSIGILAISMLLLVVLTGCPGVIANVVGAGESVQNAIKQAVTGDTIKIQGSHAEDVTVDKDSITLEGQNDASIDGTVTVNSQNVTIRNLTINKLDTKPGSFNNLTLNNVTVADWNTTLSDNLSCDDVVNSDESIDNAVDNVAPDGTVCVAPLSFTEEVSVAQTLHLLGIEGSIPTIDSDLTVDADDVAVDNFEITGVIDTTPGSFQRLHLTSVKAYGLTLNTRFRCNAVVNPGEDPQSVVDLPAITDGDTICLAPGVDTTGLQTTKSLNFYRIGTGPITISFGPTKMYWSANGADKIQRANLDGSSLEDLVSGLKNPHGIALDLTAGKMYWTSPLEGRIQRANLNGSGVEVLVTGLKAPKGIAVDPAASKMYWTEEVNDKIQRANLDGSGVEDIVTGVNDPHDIELDLTAGKMYWTGLGVGEIERANLDGSSVEQLIAVGVGAPKGIALDLTAGKMYWTEDFNDVVRRANLDGSGKEDLVTGLTSPHGITLDPTSGKMYWVDSFHNWIKRSNLDGSGVETLIDGLDGPVHISLGD